MLESTIDLSQIKELNIHKNPWDKYASTPLNVYTTGGGTWVAEYAILHGVDPRIYGSFFHHIHLLGPISQIPGRLAPSLSSIGYKTTTISPMENDFYNAEIFHKSSGIQQFISCHELQICKQKNRDLLDQKVFEKIVDVIKHSKKAELIFALTMSQHSPHLPSETNYQITCRDGFDTELCQKFSEYKKREQKLQDNIDSLIQEINQFQQHTILVFFGDHIASDFTQLTDDKSRKANQPFQTIAFAYDSQEKKYFDLKENLKNCRNDFDLSLSHLDVIALRKANFHSPYIDKKMQWIQNTCMQQPSIAQ